RHGPKLLQEFDRGLKAIRHRASRLSSVRRLRAACQGARAYCRGMAGTSDAAERKRFAVVDVGSNTVHLLVAESDGQMLMSLDDESTRLQLGADVALSG